MSADRTASFERSTQGGVPAADRQEVRRRVWAIVGGSSGNLVEWYDFHVYSFTALYFAGQFFPKRSRSRSHKRGRRLVAAITMPDTRRAGMLLAHEGRLAGVAE